MSINSRLRLVRESYGYSQANFAKFFGLAQQTYANYEMENKIVPDSLKKQLVHIFKVNLNWLIMGQGSMYLANYVNNSEDNSNIENNSSKVNERLILIRQQFGISQAKFAKNIGLPQSTYAQYEKGGRNVPDELKIELAKLGFNMHWMITGQGNMFLTDDSKNTTDTNTIETAVDIPLYEFNGEVKESISLPIQIASKYTDCILSAVKICGDSMKPTLCDGEIVIIDKAKIVGDGLFAFKWNNELNVRRLIPIGDKVKVISDNPKYPIEIIDKVKDYDKLWILGKVIFWIHEE